MIAAVKTANGKEVMRQTQIFSLHYDFNITMIYMPQILTHNKFAITSWINQSVIYGINIYIIL